MSNELAIGVYPALVGLANAFIVLGIVVLVIYLYVRYTLGRKSALPPTPKSEEVSAQPTPLTSKEGHPPEEVMVAVAAVKHYITSKSLKPPTHVYQPLQYSAWVINWVREATQTFDYNPYLKK